ncbi:hypothetical protein MBUL_04482 (plasmid) [Methylobacterium bullatum]|uniref:Helix-turn-helix domain-containing protein n=1 Tax=Methylobacterium bullatum TaxID=570505 RepID=A0A679JDQ3_9HYPH|nr:hypothetical protein MBUL_04482 [Methylobacterium bullatum]
MGEGNLLTRFRLLVAANCDPGLSPAARTVLAQILDHYNAQTGQCTPSFERLAKTTGLARRSVVRAVRELREAGWVDREHTTREDTRSHLANTFRPAFERVSGDDKVGTKQSPLGGDETVPRVGTKRCSEVGTKRSPKPSKKNIGTGTQVSAGQNSAFDEWWKLFPKKVGKDAARPVFDRVLRDRRATVDELMKGAQRYAAERHGKDAQYTKHPKSWLNGGHWADEPTAPHHQQASRSGFSALAYTAERMNADE